MRRFVLAGAALLLCAAVLFAVLLGKNQLLRAENEGLRAQSAQTAFAPMPVRAQAAFAARAAFFPAPIAPERFLWQRAAADLQADNARLRASLAALQAERDQLLAQAEQLKGQIAVLRFAGASAP